MLQKYSRAMEAQRTADAAVHLGMKAGFFPLDSRRAQAELLALESRWSFLERLYALPLAFAER